MDKQSIELTGVYNYYKRTIGRQGLKIVNLFFQGNLIIEVNVFSRNKVANTLCALQSKPLDFKNTNRHKLYLKRLQMGTEIK